MMLPRLLSERDAAAYLALPIAAVRRLPEGRVTIDGRIRYDRLRLDRWLDGTLDVAPAGGEPAANSNETGADLALARFVKSRPDAARLP